MSKLCFVGIIFDSDTEKKITEIKEEIKNKFNICHSLKTQPHITLYEPKSIEDLEAHWEECTKNIKNIGDFEVKLSGFNHFEDRVLYIDIAKSEELKQLYSLVRNKKSDSFKPHVTLAHRDINNFDKLWKEFENRNFYCISSVNRIALFVHDGEKWVIEKIKKLR